MHQCTLITGHTWPYKRAALSLISPLFSPTFFPLNSYPVSTKVVKQSIHIHIQPCQRQSPSSSISPSTASLITTQTHRCTRPRPAGLPPPMVASHIFKWPNFRHPVSTRPHSTPRHGQRHHRRIFSSPWSHISDSTIPRTLPPLAPSCRLCSSLPSACMYPHFAHLNLHSSLSLDIF
ncbi:hypothetical protein BC939DRAFT_445377 [Gamsiella multidivaricata]|uniref:uncharacterized protein n=1 Tax=Gamsiella multidivaricata TaxID=101098 RepID=UPI00221E4DE6|nr:uncharacterized protein BC939DRAFT_445377 [Gamsiella multidivaricata]KAI7827476.1 hypothetical protein BC939DRAFT_445377 [Gamsiella multidivaricata]